MVMVKSKIENPRQRIQGTIQQMYIIRSRLIFMWPVGSWKFDFINERDQLWNYGFEGHQDRLSFNAKRLNEVVQGKTV